VPESRKANQAVVDVVAVAAEKQAAPAPGAFRTRKGRHAGVASGKGGTFHPCES